MSSSPDISSVLIIYILYISYESFNHSISTFIASTNEISFHLLSHLISSLVLVLLELLVWTSLQLICRTSASPAPGAGTAAPSLRTSGRQGANGNARHCRQQLPSCAKLCQVRNLPIFISDIIGNIQNLRLHCNILQHCSWHMVF